MRENLWVQQGWIKAHIIVEVNSKKLLGIEITNEQASDGQVFPALLDQAQGASGDKTITRVLADGAYDNKDFFNRLEKDHINSGIKIRENASSKSGGSPYRAECSRKKQKAGYRAWAHENGYGKRWAV
jgi:predicted DNA binding protein